MIKGIHHITLKAKGEEEFQKTISFYEEAFGFRKLRQWGKGNEAGCMLTNDTVILELFANGTKEEQGQGRSPFRHVAFAVEDIEAEADRIKALGYSFFIEPTEKNLGGSYPVKIAFFHGPTGEDVELFEEL